MRVPWKLIGVAGLTGVVAMSLMGSRRRRRTGHPDASRAGLPAPFGPVTSNGDQAARTSTSR
jgi:hypothetical protein